jgi:integrase
MVVVKKWKEDMPKDKNYLDLATSKFIFNKYKTSKKYGTQTLDIPNTEDAPLMDVIQTYLKFHPLYKATKGKEAVPFLVTADGKALTAVNAITRILNKIFGKKVGSSMLRHIFLSDKYDIKEMEEDAEAMGHSVQEQRKYLRKEGGGEVQSVEVPTINLE